MVSTRSTRSALATKQVNNDTTAAPIITRASRRKSLIERFEETKKENVAPVKRMTRSRAAKHEKENEEAPRVLTKILSKPTTRAAKKKLAEKKKAAPVVVEPEPEPIVVEEESEPEIIIEEEPEVVFEQQEEEPIVEKEEPIVEEEVVETYKPLEVIAPTPLTPEIKRTTRRSRQISAKRTPAMEAKILEDAEAMLESSKLNVSIASDSFCITSTGKKYRKTPGIRRTRCVGNNGEECSPAQAVLQSMDKRRNKRVSFGGFNTPITNRAITLHKRNVATPQILDVPMEMNKRQVMEEPKMQDNVFSSSSSFIPVIFGTILFVFLMFILDGCTPQSTVGDNFMIILQERMEKIEMSSTSSYDIQLTSNFIKNTINSILFN